MMNWSLSKLKCKLGKNPTSSCRRLIPTTGVIDWRYLRPPKCSAYQVQFKRTSPQVHLKTKKEKMASQLSAIFTPKISQSSSSNYILGCINWRKKLDCGVKHVKQHPVEKIFFALWFFVGKKGIREDFGWKTVSQRCAEISMQKLDVGIKLCQSDRLEKEIMKLPPSPPPKKTFGTSTKKNSSSSGKYSWNKNHRSPFPTTWPEKTIGKTFGSPRDWGRISKAVLNQSFGWEWYGNDGIYGCFCSWY